jgi:hypothetical protein
MENGQPEKISSYIISSIEFLKIFEIRVIACITNNAASMISVTKKVNEVSVSHRQRLK